MRSVTNRLADCSHAGDQPEETSRYGNAGLALVLDFDGPYCARSTGTPVPLLAKRCDAMTRPAAIGLLVYLAFSASTDARR